MPTCMLAFRKVAAAYSSVPIDPDDEDVVDRFFTELEEGATEDPLFGQEICLLLLELDGMPEEKVAALTFDELHTLGKSAVQYNQEREARETQSTASGSVGNPPPRSSESQSEETADPPFGGDGSTDPML